MSDFNEMQSRALKLLPGHMVEGIIRYIQRGIPMGDFGTALLSNDLMKAFDRADDMNTAAMKNWVVFLYNYAPGDCYGSPDAVRDWIAQGGLNQTTENQS